MSEIEIKGKSNSIEIILLFFFKNIEQKEKLLGLIL